MNRTSNKFEGQYETVATQIDPTRRATHGSPVTWADRHGPYCFYLSHVADYSASFPCSPQPGYSVFNNVDDNIMNQEGPNNPMEWDEYGAAGASSVYTITQVMPPASRFPVLFNNSDWVFHRGFDAVGAGTMWLVQDGYTPLFGPAADLEAEVRASQWAQNEGLRYQNQGHRRQMPRRSMCAFWTLNEPWPNVAYGSVVDWFGEKKMAFYAATKRSFAPVDVQLTYPSLFWVAGSSVPEEIGAAVVAEASSIEKGATAELTLVTTSGKQLHTESWSVAPRSLTALSFSTMP